MRNIDIVLTLVMFTIFIVIVIWAWSPARKKQFEEAERLPLEPDDITPETTTRQQEPGHG